MHTTLSVLAFLALGLIAAGAVITICLHKFDKNV